MSDADTKKKPKQYRIAGFVVTQKTIRNLIILGVVIFGFSYASKMKKQKELEERLAAEQERLAAEEAARGDQVEYTYDEMMQIKLREKYGEPPEGFEWDILGNLVALSDESSSEDVAYTFLRALSVLDFSTAQRYSRDSSVIEEYQDYYSDYSAGYTDYYDNFIRKQYKLSIASLEVDSVEDVAVFADGTQYITLKIRALDLQNKDFWREDTEKLYENMYNFKRAEDDDVKMENYLYDYIIEKYEAGEVGKRAYTVELVLSKDNASGWLVTNDRELEASLHYEQGTNIADYIMSEFYEWYQDKVLSETHSG